MRRSNTSRGEESLARQLAFAGYEFERQFAFAPNRKWKSDFYLPAGNLIVEVEGVAYAGQALGHQTGQGYEEDCEKYNAMTELGFRLLRFTTKMVTGEAKRRAALKTVGDERFRLRFEPALTVIDRILLGDAFDEVDRRKPGYAKR